MTEREMEILDDDYTNACSMILTIICDIAWYIKKKKIMKKK